MEHVLEKYGSYTMLEICVPDEMRKCYEKYIKDFNDLLLSKDPAVFINDGFDLFVPNNVECDMLTKINFGVKIQATHITETRTFPCGVKMYARSSIYKTPLRMANSVGVIDPGYRGDIIGMFDLYTVDNVTVEKYTRLVQLCADSPIFVKMIDESELSLTNRGANGFGSSGR